MCPCKGSSSSTCDSLLAAIDKVSLAFEEVYSRGSAAAWVWSESGSSSTSAGAGSRDVDGAICCSGFACPGLCSSCPKSSLIWDKRACPLALCSSTLMNVYPEDEGDQSDLHQRRDGQCLSQLLPQLRVRLSLRLGADAAVCRLLRLCPRLWFAHSGEKSRKSLLGGSRDPGLDTKSSAKACLWGLWFPPAVPTYLNL